jgi:hypothetical protein
MEYVIEEIYEIICDVDKVLVVKFKVEGDGDSCYREIVDSDYYDWCYDLYLNDGVDTEYRGFDEEEDGYFGNHFNVDLWNLYYNDEVNVIDFIYETYIGLKSLPQSVCD